MSGNYDSGAVENEGDETGSPVGAGGFVTVEPVEVIGMVNGTVDQVIGKDKNFPCYYSLVFLFYSR